MAKSAAISKPARRNPQKSGSLTDKAYSKLEELIVTLQLEPGEVLSEVALSKELGIGRTPIREALQRLSREGLITILPRKGVLVSDINPRKQLLLLEVRRELERLIAKSAAQRCTPEERTAFTAIADGIDKASRENDDIAFMRYDDELNKLMARAAHNEYANRAIGLMHGLSRRFWYMHYRDAADLPLSARLHAQLARAIASGNADAAGKASDKLIDYVETFTKATVSA